MQAITVKFLCPTNVKGSRYKATCAAGSLTMHSDHALNPEQNAARVALALCAKLDWEGDLICGGLHTGEFVFVFANATRHENSHVHSKRPLVRINAAV